MQRYFTLQIFECFDIPIDDLWAEFDVLDGMRMRRRMHSFFCRHSILRITLSKRLVYGVNSAFEQFQTIREQTIAACTGTRSISDDILIWASSIDEMAQRLDTLFKKLHAKNVKINLTKCVFGTTKLTFAGYCLTDTGTHPDRSNVDAVNNTATPTNVTEVRSFLGLVNFCSQLIKGYAILTEPLR